jgi:methylenetetrahydrofolate reductase (NADPH)
MLNPLFIDVTWGAGGRTSDLTTELCVNAKKYCHLESQMHLTCTNMPKEKIDQALQDCKDNGIRNILALRGGMDPSSYIYILVTFTCLTDPASIFLTYTH